MLRYLLEDVRGERRVDTKRNALQSRFFTTPRRLAVPVLRRPKQPNESNCCSSRQLSVLRPSQWKRLTASGKARFSLPIGPKRFRLPRFSRVWRSLPNLDLRQKRATKWAATTRDSHLSFWRNLDLSSCSTTQNSEQTTISHDVRVTGRGFIRAVDTVESRGILPFTGSNLRCLTAFTWKTTNA
jgi:hypothetical protein